MQLESIDFFGLSEVSCEEKKLIDGGNPLVPVGAAIIGGLTFVYNCGKWIGKELYYSTKT